MKGKVINANIQTYGGSEKMTYGIGLGYYNEKGIFRGTGYNRVDLNSTMNVTPVNRLNVDLRLNASLSNRDRTSGGWDIAIGFSRGDSSGGSSRIIIFITR